MNTLKLPPISFMDNLLPNGTWKSPSPSVYLQSPPYQNDSPQLEQQTTSLSQHKIKSDMNQIIQQCHHLSENMMIHKNQLNQPEYISSKPLLDDMIQSANEVLNALLRLRKHQINYSSHYNTPIIPIANKPTTQPNNTNNTKQRKRGKRPAFQGRCHSCNISETPEWRRGPDGARTLCNACGLHYAKLARKRYLSSPS